jgi:carbamoyl-phosphate synthase large subunit
MNILISSGGRRVELMVCFREALTETALSGQVYVIDTSLTAPAFHLADKAWLVPQCSDPDFIDQVLAISRREEIRLIVPTIDAELPIFAKSRDLFAAHGVHVAISDPATVLICGHKGLTHSWLTVAGFPCTRQSTIAAIMESPRGWHYPLIVKPIQGSASKGLRVVRSEEELRAVSRFDDGLIVQELAEGQEYTINVFVDANGKCVCAVPHRRIEVRGGEVSKAVTSKHVPMMDLARDIAEKLPGARGPLNVQCFLSATGEIKIIEINARVGGGYPLAHRAGAHFTRWMVEEILGYQPTATFDGWEDELAMLRYDQTVFRPGVSLGMRQNDQTLVTSLRS